MTQKEIAISCLEKLDIYKPYIRKFKSKAGIPCFFENYAGFYADQEPKLYEKIKEIEKEYNCLVYAITHEYSSIGETWSMLCVSQEAESFEDYIFEFDKPNCFYTYAFVWNENAPYCSEFGDIVVHTFGGGIKRIY